jgi:hypothetical protein
MLWAAAVVVGVTLWLSLGILPFALWNRRQAMRSPGAFACKVRVIGPLLADGQVLPARSPRRDSAWSILTHPRRRRSRSRGRFPTLVSTAWWVSDVLAVQGGLGVTRTRLLPVAAGDSIRPLGGRGVRGLGEVPRSVLLILSDGQLVEVAVAGTDARLLAGPLVARVPAHRN